MKKTFLVLGILLFLGMTVSAATLQTAIAKYKSGNYAGCIGDLEQAGKMKEAQKIMGKYDLSKIEPTYSARKYNDPEFIKLNNDVKKNLNFDLIKDRDKLAYMNYYYALSLHQIGMSSQAGQYYKYAQFFSPNSQIGEQSKLALNCIQNPSACPTSDMDEFIRSGQQVSEDIVRQEVLDNLQKHKEQINKNAGAQNIKQNMTPSATKSNIPGKNTTKPADANNPATPDKTSMIEENEKIAWFDKGKSTSMITEEAQYKKSENNSQPTDEEIGRAIRTLQNAGINPAPYITSKADSEYAQMNAMLNDGYYYNGYNPMMMYGNQKMSPEVMQTLMQQQMMNAYGSF